MGQYVSTLNHALPQEYTETLREVQDKAPARPFSELRSVVERELGRPLSQVFRRVDEEAIAAASIAQVHYAETVDGRAVALKVQYPKL
jgi:predicted unusual protein kinase regulating ubiquinone biosynthesis (AarF/ABC1/UbiB family)